MGLDGGQDLCRVKDDFPGASNPALASKEQGAYQDGGTPWTALDNKDNKTTKLQMKNG